MAFLYRDKASKELTDEQIVADVLITHNKITADIRDILWNTGIIPFNKSTHISCFDLAELFYRACMHDFINRDKSIADLDSDYGHACMTYENFIIPHISNQPFGAENGKCRLVMGDKIITMTESEKDANLRLREKYKYYSNCVNKWYDFFMLPLDEKIKLLNIANENADD